MISGQIKDSGDLSLRLALTHQRSITARSKGKRKGIKQDRFASARLAGEHSQAGVKIEIQSIDEDNVPDRKPNQHADLPSG
jgi:hypothetical protein